MARKTPDTPARLGVILNMPGAPACPMKIPDFPLELTPDRPVPLDTLAERGITEEWVRAWIGERTPAEVTHELAGGDPTGRVFHVEGTCPVALCELDTDDQATGLVEITRDPTAEEQRLAELAGLTLTPEPELELEGATGEGA